MIYLLTLLCSMCIQFAAVNPYNMANLNSQYSSYIDTVKSQIRANKGGFWWSSPWSKCVNVPNERWIVIKGYYNSQYQDVILVLCPREDVQEGSSSVTCNGYTINNNIVDSVTVRYNGYFGFGYATSDASIQSDMNVYGYSTYNFSEGSWSLLYCETPIYYQDTLVVDSYTAPPVVSFDGHASGWSDLIQDVDGEKFTILGHGFTFDDNTLDTLNIYWENHAGDDFTESLLAMNNRILSGINDSLSFGLGVIGKDMNDLLGWCNDFLSLFGTSLEELSDKELELLGVANDTYDKLDGYIDYVSEPFDAAEWDLMMSSGTIADFSSLAHSIERMTTERTDSQHIYISWNFGNVQYFGGASGRVDMAQYLNSSKSVWQPLILTFLYAALIWQFVKSLPNLLQGASSSVNTETRNSKNP